MKKSLSLLIFVAFLLAACTLGSEGETARQTQPGSDLPAASQTSALPPDVDSDFTGSTPPTHPIQIRLVEGEAEFYNQESGETFYPRGVNYIQLVDSGAGYLENRVFEVGRYDPASFSAEMARLANLGYNTVRLFIDTCSTGTGCITDYTTGRLNGAYLDNLVSAMAIARENGIFLLLTSNDLPTEGDYWKFSNQRANDDPQMEGYRNAHILTEDGRESAVLYWTDLMAGLTEREADFDAVLGWSLLNEQWLFGGQPPLSLNEGVIETGNGKSYDMADPYQKRAMVTENLLLYIEEVGVVIRSYDPDGMVTMGFFAPAFPNDTMIGGTWYVDTAALIQNGAALDFYDFHAYPGDDLTLEQFAENFGFAGHAEIAVIMGEYGAFIHRYPTIEGAARASTEWAAESCKYGWDGWLYWSYFDLPEEIGDATWGLREQGDFMLDLFAPAHQPDICHQVDVPTANLAYGKPVVVSRQIPEGPGKDALDENSETGWQAGAYPPQWIKIDLEAPYTLSEVRLQIGQWPAGETIHRVYVRQAGKPDAAANWQLVHEFAEYTQSGDWLIFTPESMPSNIQYVMVETVSSPSWVDWREIQVFGQAN